MPSRNVYATEADFDTIDKAAEKDNRAFSNFVITAAKEKAERLLGTPADAKQ